MSLASDLRRIAQQRKQSISKVYRGTMLAMGSSVIRMSPVDEGRFRGNWFTGIGFDDESIDMNSISSTASTTRLLSGVSSLNTNEHFYFVNNLPYAKKLEDGGVGGGGSEQAPNGMIKVVINDFASIVEQKVRESR